MDQNTEISREEMERIIKESERQLQEALARMSPEERQKAEQLGWKAVKDDEAQRQQLLDSAAEVLKGSSPQQAAPAPARFCKHCGAPIKGKFCEYCGMPV